MRYSRQREALLELLRSTKTHPDAEWLYLRMREELPSISLGTVYRNLRQLAESGEILELSCGNASHFDGDITPHHHMQCIRCKKILDIPKENVIINIKSDSGFQVEGFELVLNGYCRECKEI